MVKLSEELAAAGWGGDPHEFRVLVADLKNGMYRNWTDEELTFHCLDAHQFCNVVRHRSGLPNIPDDLIMRTLVNYRKHFRNKDGDEKSIDDDDL